MGHGSYSIASRTSRAVSAGYATKTLNEIFTQNAQRRIHKDMNPFDIKLREACDSTEHPTTVPVQLYLDDTGSMGDIPHLLIKDGLPTLIGKLQTKIPDIALMFGAIGDHECDEAPLQISQFESGDAELDMWLTRTWLEANGGTNYGESYLLAWYFAGFHTRTDAFDKRKQKCFVFTVGDEPCLRDLPGSAIKTIMGSTAIQGQGNYTAEQLLEKAQEQNEVFHIFVEHGGRKLDDEWKVLMGSNLIVIDDHKKLVDEISNTILNTLGLNTL